MAKWYGSVGFAERVEIEPGIWDSVITEKLYYGDVISNRWRRQSSGEINDDINISNSISVLIDPYAYEKFSSIVYVEFMGAKWKVTDIEVQHPRLILTIGGLWNGEKNNATEPIREDLG